MKARLLGFFSGFPTHHFTEPIMPLAQEHLERMKK